MDIDQNVNQIVQSIVGQITTQIQSQVMAVVEARVKEAVNAIDYTPIVSAMLNQKLTEKISALPLNTSSLEQELTSRVADLASTLVVDVKRQAADLVKDNVHSSLKLIDLNDSYQNAIITAISNKKINFPDRSIPISALQIEDIQLTGESIVGGIIKNFGSTGIDDLATACQLTITDDLTVVENNLLTKDLTVKGSTTIEGDLFVTGKIPDNSPMFVQIVNAAAMNVKTTLDETLFTKYAKTVTDQIYSQGIDLTSIKINGQDVINHNALGSFVTQSNLQRVGVLQELQTAGETFLTQTLYVTDKRVGINTIEPTHALSLWDQEIEMSFGKLETNTAFIAVPRAQKLVIGSNGKKNIVLDADGGVSVNSIKINNMTFVTGSTPPSYDAAKGTIVFNENPTLGGPLGWVSLGEARWANFGIID